MIPFSPCGRRWRAAPDEGSIVASDSGTDRRIDASAVCATPHPTPDVVRGHLLPQGEKVTAEARQWLGTPYRHQASLRGVACDCLGLVRGVWRALHGQEPQTPPPYRPDWAELGEREILLEALGRWLLPLSPAYASPGDVLVFRMQPGAIAKHCAILSAEDRMIHAYWGRACVESWLGRWWRERLVAAFRFPEPPPKIPLSPAKAGAQIEP